VCRLRPPALKPHTASWHGACVLSWIGTMRISNTAQQTPVALLEVV